MRVAALYDIHGNLPALEAVLAEVERASVDRVVVGGDVFPGPLAGEALDRLLELGIPTQFIRGNGERELLNLAAGRKAGALPEQVLATLRWCVRGLDAARRRSIERWPATARVGIDGLGETLFCHATPRSDTEIFTRETAADRLQPLFAGVDAALVVCGHTHMQFDRSVGGTRVVNAGSVGMPFGRPGAYWLLLGPGVELRRSPYDLERAARRIRATDYPGAEEFAAGSVLRPPSERETLERFARAATAGG